MTRRAAIAVVRRRTPEGLIADQDLVAVEAALDVRVATTATPAGTPLGILMRTPGDDEDLLRGLLFAEGAIRTRSDVAAIHQAPAADGSMDTAVVRLADHVVWDARASLRVGVSSSACGLCGRLTAMAVDAGRACRPGAPPLSTELIQSLPERLRAGQLVFGETGGLHAAALFDAQGGLRLLREDVGRHNAVDKAIGESVLAGVDRRSMGLLTTARISAEIALKAARADLAWVASRSIPTTLAVEIAGVAALPLIARAAGPAATVIAPPAGIDAS